MSNLIDIIKNRRSVRKFKDQDVPESVVNQILEAVRWAPSWANTQCWEIVVIRDHGIKEQLQATLGPKNPATKAVVAAPVLIALCSKMGVSGFYGQVSTKFGDWFMFDLGLATQNLCLTAHDLGLGTVIIGLFDHDRAKAILNVPQGYELVVLIAIGVPEKIPSAPKRKEIQEFTHYEKFM